MNLWAEQKSLETNLVKQEPLRFYVTDEHLRLFNKLEKGLQEVRTRFQKEMSRDIPLAQAETLREGANIEMRKIVEVQGLSADNYNYIRSAIEVDPKIQQRYFEIIKQ